METVALTSLRWTALFFCFLRLTCAEEEVKAKPGETVTLPCKAPNNNDITVVEWSRPGREPECVFLYRDERIDPDSQNPVFKDRVDLQDKQMKDGNASVILKDVTAADSGNYECRLKQSGTNRRKRAVYDSDPINIINLNVVAPPPGPTGGDTEDGGSVGLIVGLPVFAVLLLGAVGGFLIYRKHKQKQSNGSYQPPAEL